MKVQPNPQSDGHRTDNFQLTDCCDYVVDLSASRGALVSSNLNDKSVPSISVQDCAISVA